MSNMLLALEITALGMGLVFAAIILLWLMMVVLTAITADDKEFASDSPQPAPAIDGDVKAQAAAIAVAIALAEQQESNAHSLSTPPTALVSAWQLGMRTRQLYQKGIPIKRQPRNIGR
jgi:Na+-transporting methylmalonyl-CoA/oxaloacetate decarboxylase gamma subunit